MKCPNCAVEDPAPVSSDNETTTCPKCGHRFPIEEPEAGQRAATLELERELARPGG